MTQPDGLPPLSEVIAAHDLRAKKSLGQNFLLDLNLTARIARAGGPLDNQAILEIGPGPGGLTRALLSEGAAHVIAVERDKRCLDALEEIAAAYPGRLTVVEADAMAIDEAALAGKHGPLRVVANLPYNVGTALLIKWLSAAPWPPWWLSLTLMFQREVAERLIAQPRTSAYGRLSILTQWRAKAQILFDISPRAFTPAPKVTSSLVRLELLPEPVAPADLLKLEKVTAAAFGQRRKMLRSSLRRLMPNPDEILRAEDIDSTRRAEELTVAEFCALARVLE
jgi:16S rRNA (adenine1518-N6/adenine1519-N6)-dimethyltransferase